MNKETGGPAFPTLNEHQAGARLWHYQGMTLRDYFAAQVLVGLSVRREGKSNENDAINAYALADAMLKAREA